MDITVKTNKNIRLCMADTKLNINQFNYNQELGDEEFWGGEVFVSYSMFVGNF